MRTTVFAGLVIASSANGQTLTFTDVTEQAGLDAGYTAVPMAPPDLTLMMAGGAVGDFNRDGRPDIFVLSGGPAPDRLYINDGDGTFSDQAGAWGVDRAHRGSGATVGDVNADGLPDIYVTSLGDPDGDPTLGAHLLYRNNGDGTFTEVAAQAGVNATPGPAPDGFSAAFGDYDLDGDLDLAAALWVQENPGLALFRNDGSGAFTLVNDQIGLDTTNLRAFTPCFADIDGDRRPELLVAADFQTTSYFVNTGGAFQRLTRQETGLTEDHFGMGAVVADITGDGFLDWFISNIIEDESVGQSPYEGCGQTLYVNQGGAHSFVDVAGGTVLEDGHWGWGTDAADFDNDGDLDIVEVNGWFGRTFEDDPCVLWLNQGDGSFTEAAAQTGLIDTGQGRGVATLDYDLDGDVDVLVFNHNGPLRLFRNDLVGPGANHLRINLDTSAAPHLAPDGVGASVTITVQDEVQRRYVDGGPTYLAVSELTEHFGLGGATVVDEVLVEWSDGSVTRLEDVAANQTLTIGPPDCCACADVNADGIPDWGSFDVDGDGVVDLDDLYACVQEPFDVNGDGAADNADAACLEAFLRRNELADMTAGRR